MVATDSPAVARRRLRLALRKAREAKGYTQSDVADALEWSLSKVNRIESGEVTISKTDLRALLGFLGVEDAATIESFTQDARTSRRRGWWDEPRYRAHLNPGTIQMLQFESEASVIRHFSPTLIPGIAQTPDYATAILDFWSDDLSESDRAVRLEVRLNRRQHVLDRENPPQYHIIMDESVVLRQVGGPQAMAEQLAELLNLIRLERLTVRVVPLADAGAATMLGLFVLFDLGEEENAVLYRESHLQDAIVQAPEEVLRHRRIFDQLWLNSLTEDATEQLITARRAAVLSSLDRPRPAERPGRDSG